MGRSAPVIGGPTEQLLDGCSPSRSLNETKTNRWQSSGPQMMFQSCLAEMSYDTIMKFYLNGNPGHHQCFCHNADKGSCSGQSEAINLESSWHMVNKGDTLQQSGYIKYFKSL